jgi:aquaporin Z
MQTVSSKSMPATPPVGWLNSIRAHWPEYLMEAGSLGTLMIAACVFTVLLEHPMSPIHHAFDDPVIRRVLLGVATGAAEFCMIFSPWGQRSGAHMNPSVTLTFLMLGKVARWDAFFYILFQFLGGTMGVVIAAALIGPPLQHSSVNFAVTIPGPQGPAAAFLAECVISVALMSAILWISNSRRWSRYTPFFASALIALFVSVEAPLSGTSMNPARSLGSAFSAEDYTGLWIYFLAPSLSMVLASVVYRFRRSSQAVFCAKLHHNNQHRCIFNCRYAELQAE